MWFQSLRYRTVLKSGSIRCSSPVGKDVRKELRIQWFGVESFWVFSCITEAP